MSNNLKQMIKQINDGKNLEVYIPSYATGLMDSYYKYSMLRMTMNYYTLYEVASDNQESTHVAGDVLTLINQTIDGLFKTSISGEETETMVKKLDAARMDIIKKMQILTAYIDRLQIYEYVLNRMELNFEEQLDYMDDSLFSQKLIQYIFNSKDNMVINDKIREVMGQLPVRMSRKKYFELIKESLSVYKGGDKSSVDSYIYMLETCSMLYEPEGGQEEFTQFKELIQELETTQYSELTKEEHATLAKKIPVVAEQITGITDWYVSLQEILNNLYVLVLANPYAMVSDEAEMLICKEIIQTIHKLFEAKQFGDLPTNLEEKLGLLEGAQESVLDICNLYESVLLELKTNHSSMIDSLMLGTIFENLYLMQKLQSTSIFIDIQEEIKEEVADEEYIAKVTEAYITKISDLFQKNQKSVNRAIIANTIGKMPVFFTSSDEVAQYIINSLEQCRDRAEKNVCIHILNEIMEEEQRYQKF